MKDTAKSGEAWNVYNITFISGQYKQNACPVHDTNCVPCPERLPSCIGMGDGDQPVVARLWSDIHVVCYRNRTLQIKHCPNGAVFEPNRKECISKLTSGTCMLINVNIQLAYTWMQSSW